VIQADLGERRLEDVLAASEPWDSTAQSVVVAEGLTQYLTPSAVQDLFVQCGAVVGVGSRIAFTYVGTGDDNRPDVGQWTGLILRLLKTSGEPWLWSIRPAELSAFLAKAGWTRPPQLGNSEGKCGVEYHAVAAR
jgi:O-methyltransferase involved in polyketide biosynthesis